MKKIVNVQEVDGEGLVALLGERVELFCMNYIYAGTLVWCKHQRRALLKRPRSFMKPALLMIQNIRMLRKLVRFMSALTRSNRTVRPIKDNYARQKTKMVWV
jgi:hypothetical protein